jgi:Ca-activated chloride channel homolog
MESTPERNLTGRRRIQAEDMSRTVRVAACAAMLVGVVLIASRAQDVKIDPRSKPDPSPAPPAQTNLRIDSNLVLVPVSVCDPMNKPVTGLEKEHFKVLDDKVEQTITHFSMDDEPVDVGLVFDISGSMGAKLRRSRAAAAAFFQTANPEDEFFLVEFNDQPKLAVPLTQDTGEIQNQLTFAESKGRTALLDAIFLALHEMKKSAKPRKALLIISDGGDNSSRYTEGELRTRVRESDVLIYAIGIFEAAGGRDRSPEESNGPALLNDVAEATGGRFFDVADVAEMPDIAAKIGIELRNRYVLGYSPTSAQRDGKYHRVQVKVIPPRGLPPLKAYWRPGYYAPVN